MKLKSEAHEALSFLFQQGEVLPALLCDNDKVMIQGDFNRKLKEVSCHLRQTESFTQWSNAAEGEREIKKLKKGSSRKMIKSRSPKRLWDDCLKLESYFKSNTACGTNWMGKFSR